MQRTLRHPGFWLSCGLTAIGVFFQYLILIPLELVGMALNRMRTSGEEQLHLSSDPLALGVANILAFGAAIAIGVMINRVPFRTVLPQRKLPLLAWVAIPLLAVGAGIVLSEFDNCIRWVLPPPQWMVDIVGSLFLSKDRLFSLLFTLVVVAPVTEELLFRGVILRGLLGRFSTKWALVISAGLFAVMHQNPWQAGPAFFLGLLFGWYYLRTQSLWPCIAGHALNNLLSFVVMQGAFGLWEPPTVEDYSKVEFMPWWVTALGLATLAGGLGLFRWATAASATDWDAPRPPRNPGQPLPPVLPSPAPEHQPNG
jgi:membrane protease YdiL (CAAX protease family)